jgi:hypothetical protein
MLIEFKKGDLFTICLWAEEDGTCESYDFLEKLRNGGKREQQDYQTLVEHRIKQMANRGAILNEYKSRELDDGIYEFKSKGGARLLWFYDKTQSRVVICTHGFHKPPSNRGYRPEIRKARRVRDRYQQNDH